ncbi:CHAT domain-containing protein [Nannocystaceae bacterium ST9]
MPSTRPLARALRRIAPLVLMATCGCQIMLMGIQDRENRHQRYTDRGIQTSASGRGRAVDSQAALRRARDLVERPLSPETGKRLRFLLWGLHAQRLYAADHVLTPELRDEADDWYRRARALAEQTDSRGRNTGRSAGLMRFGTGLETPDDVDEVYGIYLMETGRSGEALRLLEPLARRSPPPSDPEFWTSLGLARLARGDLAGARAAFDGRPSVLADAFAPTEEATPDPATPDPATPEPTPFLTTPSTRSSPTLTFGQMRRRFDALALPENHPHGQVDRVELLALWKQIEVVARDVLTKSYTAYLEGAKTFADAGEIELAKGLLRTAARADKSDGHDPAAPLAQLCAAAYVAARADDPEAVAGADACIERSKRKRRPLDAADKTAFAEAYTRAGRLDEAIELLQAAIAELEATRSSFAVDERAQFFRTAARRSYWALIRAHGLRAMARGPSEGASDIEAALRVTEQVRARQLGEVLGERGRAIAEFDDLAQLRERLGEDEALLSYVATERDVLAIAIDDDAWSFVSLPISGAALASVTGELARGLARPSTSPALLEEQLTLLGRALLRPFNAIVADAQVLTVLPDGVLNTIPFDLLSLDSTWSPLLERVTVRLTPSLGFYLTPHRGRPIRDGLLALGDPIMPEGVPALPETRTEIERIALQFAVDRRHLLLGAEARESGLAGDLSSYGAIHLATHGILGRELPGVVEPALIVSAEPGEDGFLTATEVAELSLDAEITVLSACKTGLGDLSSGEGVFGMSRAFLLAGSSSVVVSLWSVDSRATEALMVEFYAALQSSDDPYAALRAAKLRLRQGRATALDSGDRGLELDEGRATPNENKHPSKKRKPAETTVEPPPDPWRHPYYWGAFTLIGR